jgi:hypothetical protein
MNKPSLLLVAAVAAIWPAQAPVLAADFEGGAYPYADHLSCLEMAREEGRLIIEISLLHPAVKHDRRGEAAAQVKDLKIDKRSIHRERRRVECI